MKIIFPAKLIILYNQNDAQFFSLKSRNVFYSTLLRHLICVSLHSARGKEVDKYTQMDASKSKWNSSDESVFARVNCVHCKWEEIT